MTSILRKSYPGEVSPFLAQDLQRYSVAGGHSQPLRPMSVGCLMGLRFELGFQLDGTQPAKPSLVPLGILGEAPEPVAKRHSVYPTLLVSEGTLGQHGTFEVLGSGHCTETKP